MTVIIFFKTMFPINKFAELIKEWKLKDNS